MPIKEEPKKYKYSAVDINNKKNTGVMLAQDEAELRRLLLETNMYLVSCKVISDNPVSFFSVSSKVKMTEITTFCREFAIMISAGIPIVDALNTLRTQTYTALFKKVLNMVHEDVRTGHLLSAAFKRHKKIFPELFSSMAYVGEISGSLDIIMNQLADYYESDTRIKRKAKSALIYPMILLVMTFAVSLLLVIFIIPTFKKTLNSLNVEMPALTVTIMNISDFFVNQWTMILIIVGALAVLIFGLTRLEKVKYFIDMLKCKIPVLKGVTISLIAARFARGFGTLIASGVDIIQSLEIMSDILGNRYFTKKFKLAQNDIEKGMTISASFHKHKVFPEMLIQMIAIGEQTGSLDSVITRTTPYFDEQVETTLSRLTALLEPTIIVFMGIVVCTIIFAVFSPMLGIMNTL